MTKTTQDFGRLVYSLQMNPRDYCLFLGAGASVDSGAKDATSTAYEILKEIFYITNGSSLNLNVTGDREKLQKWFDNDISCAKILEKFAGDHARREIIRKYMKDLKPSSGYEMLASLVKNGFFKIAFTTNFDNLLEKSLQLQDLELSTDFEVLIYGKDKEEVIYSRLYDTLREKTKTFIILKLHGDLSYPSTLKITPEETSKFSKRTSRIFRECFSRFGIIFIGYSGKDKDVTEILRGIRKTDYPHWFISKVRTSNKQILDYLRRVKSETNILWNEEGFGPGLFDDFFTLLHSKLIRPNINKFLDEIKRLNNPWYCKIDRIFVPSNEYFDIITSLEKNKVVFLVGDPEIGKTFTAVRVLWEYYCKGFTPIWHSGSEINQRMQVRQIMTDLNIVDHSVVYLEDPFGKIKFEDREELRREIGNFLIRAQSVDARVIITSREEPFKEFEKEKLSQSDLRSFSIEMNLMKPSYNDEKKKKILLNWAKEFDCQWLRKKRLKSFVIKEGLKRLSTPLALRDFAFASKDCADRRFIDEQIKEKSIETKKAFAEEITNMPKEKVLFLSLVYILGQLKTEKILTIYDKICRKFGLNPKGYPFEYLKGWFETKIARNRQDAPFEFTHPSYEEGLVRSWSNSKVENFFIDFTSELIREDDPVVRGWVGFILVRNFEEISFKDQAKRLIKTVLHDKSANARNGVAEATRFYFANLPMNLALEYLYTMANDRHREIRGVAVEIVGDNFKKFPIQESLKFISKSLEDRAALVRLETVTVVRNNLEDIPEEIVVKALKCCEELRHYSGWSISYFAGIIYHNFKERVENPN